MGTREDLWLSPLNINFDHLHFRDIFKQFI
jgi:hypothetical protein